MNISIIARIKSDKRITTLLQFLIIVIILTFLLIRNALEIGELLNNVIFHCASNPMNSFPCYWIYPIYLFLFFSVAAIFLLWRIVYLLAYRNNTHSKTQEIFLTIFYSFLIWWILIVLWTGPISLFWR